MNNPYKKNISIINFPSDSFHNLVNHTTVFIFKGPRIIFNYLKILRFGYCQVMVILRKVWSFKNVLFLFLDEKRE